jgi:hypothetical protein
MTTQRDLAINRLLETIKNQEAILKRLNKIIVLAVIVVIIQGLFLGWQIGKVQALQEINQTLQLQDRG